MVTNEREYRIARAELRKFEDDLAQPQKRADQPGVDPVIMSAIPAILSQQLEDLRAEIREYEVLRSGERRSWTLRDLTNLTDVLVEARIARGLTQRGLAEKLNIKEQSVQRYEDNRYSGASLERLTGVAKALALQFSIEVSLDPVPSRSVFLGGIEQSSLHFVPGFGQAVESSTWGLNTTEGFYPRAGSASFYSVHSGSPASFFTISPAVAGTIVANSGHGFAQALVLEPFLKASLYSPPETPYAPLGGSLARHYLQSLVWPEATQSLPDEQTMGAIAQ